MVNPYPVSTLVTYWLYPVTEWFVYNSKVNFDLIDEGSLDRYLGVEVKRQSDGSIELTQQYLIGRIVKDVGLNPKMISFKTTSVILPLLNKEYEGLPHNKN